MKKILLPLLACGMFASAWSQNDATPCCGIIAKDIKKNLVVARDNTTGRLYQLKTDALDIKAININDAVTINQQTKKITGIGGAIRNYNIMQPDKAEPPGILAALRIDNGEPISEIVTPKINYIDPCCNVVSIEPDPIDPCCAIVSFKNISTGALSKFRAPKNVSSGVKIGQPVYAEPIGAMKINNAGPINSFAIVQSSFGNSGMASYGYPATSADGTSGNEDAAKWVINKVNAKSGTGKLFVNLPSGSEWDMTIYAAGSDKVLSNTMLQQNFSLLPGSYDLEINHIKITGVPVEKGNNTRLKTGVLHITNSTSWTLYDETKQTVLINGVSAQKRGLPIGKYKLAIMGQDVAIEIKDGGTVEY